MESSQLSLAPTAVSAAFARIGIQAFANSAAGIDGSAKNFYEDFIVNEVGLDGVVLEPGSTELPLVPKLTAGPTTSGVLPCPESTQLDTAVTLTPEALLESLKPTLDVMYAAVLSDVRRLQFNNPAPIYALIPDDKALRQRYHVVIKVNLCRR